MIVQICLGGQMQLLVFETAPFAVVLSSVADGIHAVAILRSNCEYGADNGRNTFIPDSAQHISRLANANLRPDSDL